MGDDVPDVVVRNKRDYKNHVKEDGVESVTTVGDVVPQSIVVPIIKLF